jgi:hypothetical protein
VEEAGRDHDTDVGGLSGNDDEEKCEQEREAKGGSQQHEATPGKAMT